MRRAIFPGTFDPFTIGHFSIVTRALTFMDEVIIGIGINENKNTYFPIEKRVAMIQNFYRNDPRIKVYSYDCHASVPQLSANCYNSARTSASLFPKEWRFSD